MALPWLTALKVIPWGDVIEHAPAVLRGARRLLERQRTAPAPFTPPSHAMPPDLAALQQQLVEMQRQQASDMTQLMQTVTELAEQNERLVEAVEVLRWRTRWLGGLSVVLLIGVVVLAFA